MKILKIIGTFVLLAVVVACAPSVSKNAAKIAYHHEMSNLVADCERLGPVTGEVEATWHASTQKEKYMAELALTEAALVKYPGEVDNVVFISTVKVTEGKNTIFAQGAAFKCNGLTTS